jgi:AAA domain/Bifunctional DNA primase/polymerase, N-terminal
MNSPTEIRLALREAGYSPLPVDGKRPPMSGWADKVDVSADEIGLWSRLYARCENTGALTRYTPTLDIDILHPDASEDIEQLARDMFGDRGTFLVRIGRHPKRAIPFRCTTPFKKIAATFVGTEEKLEFLADGQQVVLFGLHKDTHKPYAWFGGEPGRVRWKELPAITEAEARELIEAAARLLVEKYGYTRAMERPKSNGHEAHAGGTADWAALIHNILNGQSLHDSLRDTAGKLVTAGMSKGAAVNFLRAMMQQVPHAPHDMRWQERFDDVPRLVDSAGGGSAATATTLNSKAASQYQMRGVRWFWKHRFALGKIGLIGGMPDKGKGLLAAYMCAACTNGEPWPCDEGHAPRGDAILFTAEDDIEDTVIPRLTAAGADLTRTHIVEMAKNPDGSERMFSLVTDLPALKAKIEEVGNVVLVIIDPLSSYLGVGKINNASTSDVRGVLAPLKKLAEDHRVAILGVMHFNKKDGVIGRRACG